MQPIHLSFAQQTNLEVFQSQVIQCLGSLPETSPQFILDTPSSHTFIQSALIAHWKSDSYTIFNADSTYSDLTTSLPTLRYKIEEASVSYERLPKKKVQRNIRLTTHFTLISIQGMIDADSICTKNFTDAVSRKELTSLESSAFPETRAPHPAKGWIQRYIEPVILTTATVLGVYLFFTLRSDSNNDGA